MLTAVENEPLVVVASGGFGREYSRQGSKLLRVLAPSALPLSVNVVYSGIARVRKRIREIPLMIAAVAGEPLP